MIIPTQFGEAKIWSFGTRTVIGELSYATNGTLKVKGYNHDQVDGMVELFNAGMEAGKAAAK